MFTNEQRNKKLSMCMAFVLARCLVLWGDGMMHGVWNAPAKQTGSLRTVCEMERW